MGGTKKKSVGSSAKTQDGGPQDAEERKDKKEKGGKGGQQKAKISVILNEGQGMKALADLKAITPQALARSTGVKVSVANSFLQSLEAKGTIRNIGGYSGHKVYAMEQTDTDGPVKKESKPVQKTAEEKQPAEEPSSS